MLFVGFMEYSFALFCHYWRPFVFLHISDYNRIDWCFWQNSQWATSKLVISSSWLLCTVAHCRWTVTVDQQVTEELSRYVNAAEGMEDLPWWRLFLYLPVMLATFLILPGLQPLEQMISSFSRCRLGPVPFPSLVFFSSDGVTVSPLSLVYLPSSFK